MTECKDMMGEAFKFNVQDTGMRTHLLMMGKGKSFEELRELAREWESVNRGDVDNAECYRIQSSRLVGNNVNNRSYGEGIQSSVKPLAASIYRVEAGYENNSCRRNKLVGKCE